MPGAEVDGLGIVVEDADELGGKGVGDDADDLCGDNGAKDAEEDAFADPVVLFGPQILTHEGGQGHGEAGDGQKGEAFDLGVGGAAGHGGFAEAVDVALDHQIGHGDDGILDTGRQAEPDDALEAFPMETDLLQPQPVGFSDPHQTDTAQQRADALGNGGGDGRRTDTETQTRYQHQIQHHIDAGGDHQIVQRMLAVAHRVEDAHEDVVHNGEDGAAEIIAEIGDGFRQYLRRSTHPPQNGGCEGNAQHRQ